MNVEGSNQSSELNSYHRDISPSFSSGFVSLVISDQAAVAHQPAEGALDDPAAGQDFESLGLIRTLDYLHLQFRSEVPDPLRKVRSAISAVDPKQAQPMEPAQGALQQALRAFALGSGWLG
jgi:hypothetical protein